MIFKYFRKIQREYDLKELWPICKEGAPTLSDAKTVFAFHVFNNPVWPKDYSEKELVKLIEELE